MDVIKSLLQSKQYRNIFTLMKVKKEIDELFNNLIGGIPSHIDMITLKSKIAEVSRDLDSNSTIDWSKVKYQPLNIHPGQRGYETLYTSAEIRANEELRTSARSSNTVIDASDSAPAVLTANGWQRGTISSDHIQGGSMTLDTGVIRFNDEYRILEADLSTIPSVTTYGLRGSRSQREE